MNAQPYFPLPVAFFAASACLLLASWRAWRCRQAGWGLPSLMVLATITVWYFFDIFYNDYGEYLALFGLETMAQAWWQVSLFLVSFTLLCPALHRALNRGLVFESRILPLITKGGIESKEIQARLDAIVFPLVAMWAVLTGIAIYRVGGDIQGLFAPWMGHKSDPWGRGRIGGGFDALLSLAAYLKIFLGAAFLLLAALATRWSTRFTSLLISALILPYFIFDRTRNTMLATIVPGILAWVFIRFRGSWLTRFAILVMALAAIDAWFRFVLANRSGSSIAEAVRTFDAAEEARHEGLNMFEELCWMTLFVDVGAYQPNMGGRYFAEIVNPIPRSLWPGKPLIGLDYAEARGQGGASEEKGGVHATISTGMIGQGVNNFGRIGGPLAAAFLMACWVAILARQDLLGRNPSRLLLYGLGFILTFNMGRDITLLVVYPFAFGWLLVWWLERDPDAHRKARPQAPAAMAPRGGP